MATISIDYDSNGDVELVFEKNITTDRADSPCGTSSTETNLLRNFAFGYLDVKVKEVRLRASSTKLIESSKYFQAMLEGSRFREGQDLKKDGLAVLPFSDPEDDPKAMIIILGIVYDDVQLPQEVDLETLYNLATLIDKFQFDVPVLALSRAWFEKLVASRGLPVTFDESLLKWLWIAWTFKIHHHFPELTRVAMWCGIRTIDLMDEKILLPSKILKAINDKRKTGFEKIERVLTTFREVLRIDNATGSDNVPVSHMTKCMVFGHATLLTRKFELCEFAAFDHRWMSIQMVSNRINSAQYTDGFSVKSISGESISIVKGAHWDLKTQLARVVQECIVDLGGLDLFELKREMIMEEKNQQTVS